MGAEWYHPRSAVYDIDQTQVGQEHASVLEKCKLNVTSRYMVEPQ